MKTGVPSRATSSATGADRSDHLCCPQRSGPSTGGRRARHSPEPSEDFTSTTSPGSSDSPGSAGGGEVGHENDLDAPGALLHGALVDVVGAVAHHDAGLMFSRTTRRPISSCAARAPLTELEHLAEHRDRAAGAAGHDGERRAAFIESGFALYASSITVTPSGRSVTAMRCGLSASAAARAARDVGQGDPEAQRTAAARERVAHVVLADEPERDVGASARRSSGRDASVNLARPGAVEDDVPARDGRRRDGAEGHDVAGAPGRPWRRPAGRRR